MTRDEEPNPPGESSVPPPVHPPAHPEPAARPEHPPMVSESVPGEPGMPRSRRTWFLAGIAAAVLAVLAGGGTWLGLQLMSSGPPVTSALPDTTVAFVGIDLDPSASQKLAAIEFMSKFPGITDHLSFKPSDSSDLRKWLMETVAQASTCPNFDFDTQVGPWLGKRAAFAGAPNAEGTLTPFAVIQVNDEQKAKDAFASDFGCGNKPPAAGIAFVGQYLVYAEHQADADFFANEAQSSPLGNSADYKALMAKVGSPGVASAYVAPGAAQQIADEAAKQSGVSSSQLDSLKSQLSSFQGMAAVVRFSGGTLEMEMVTSSDKAPLLQGAQSPVADLPGTTAFAFGAGSSPDSATTSFNKVWRQALGNDPNAQRQLKVLERQTGITLPEDFVTLFGGGYAFAVDSSFDPNAFRSRAPNYAALTFGFRFVGDPQAITTVLDKVQALVAPAGVPLTIKQGDGAVGVSLSSHYASELAGSGGLGSTAAYQAAVSGTPAPASVLYVDLGTVRSWIKTLDKGDPSLTGILDNLAPMDALGASAYADGGDSYVIMRLTTR